LEHGQARRKVVLDYHKDHLSLGDIAVLCLQACRVQLKANTGLVFASKGALFWQYCARPG
jgi:hypothetical protein